MNLTCPDDGRLRAWLDGERADGGPKADATVATTTADPATLAAHVRRCAACRATVAELRANAAAASAALQAVALPMPNAAETERALARLRGRCAVVPAGAGTTAQASRVGPLARPVAPHARGAGGATAARLAPILSPSPTATPTPTKEEPAMALALPFQRWRLALGGLAAGLALALLAVSPEAQAAASGFLAQFRTQRFAVVTFDPSQGGQGRNNLGRLERLGTMERSLPRNAAEEVATVEEASRRVGFPVRRADPASLPAGVAKAPTIKVAPAGEMRFTFDRDKARAYFQEIGRPDVTLPDTLHGTTLVVSMPPMALVQYATGEGRPPVVVGQSGEVRVDVQGRATLDEVRDFLLSQPGLPADMARQLRAIQDWRTTLPIPVPVDKIAFRETTIQGGPGLILTDNTGLGSGALWQRDGRIHGVAGPLKGDELQRVIDNLR